MATYTIHCVRGLIKQECPIFQQKEIMCVECLYARYILRQHQKERNNQESEQK